MWVGLISIKHSFDTLGPLVYPFVKEIKNSQNSKALPQQAGLFLLGSGWPDLNRRPSAPHADAIPGYATSRRTQNYVFLVEL